MSRRERARRAVAPLIVDDQAQFADVDGGGRPAPFVGERAKVVFIVEPRHRVVGLRLEAGAGDPAARQRFEHRKASAAQKPVHQRGDEHRLAGAREPGDAEPDGRVHQGVAVVEQRARRELGFLPEVIKAGGHRRSAHRAGRVFHRVSAGCSRPSRGSASEAARRRTSSCTSRRPWRRPAPCART